MTDVTRYPNRWKQGQSGNAAGRKLGARNRFSEQFMSDVADAWAKHGGLCPDDHPGLSAYVIGLVEEGFDKLIIEGRGRVSHEYPIGCDGRGGPGCSGRDHRRVE